jgi:hypothetical protein
VRGCRAPQLDNSITILDYFADEELRITWGAMPMRVQTDFDQVGGHSLYLIRIHDLKEARSEERIVVYSALLGDAAHEFVLFTSRRVAQGYLGFALQVFNIRSLLPPFP